MYLARAISGCGTSVVGSVQRRRGVACVAADVAADAASSAVSVTCCGVELRVGGPPQTAHRPGLFMDTLYIDAVSPKLSIHRHNGSQTACTTSLGVSILMQIDAGSTNSRDLSRGCHLIITSCHR